MKKNNQSFESARKQVDKYAAGILGRISDEKEVGSKNMRSLGRSRGNPPLPGGGGAGDSFCTPPHKTHRPDALVIT